MSGETKGEGAPEGPPRRLNRRRGTSVGAAVPWRTIARRGIPYVAVAGAGFTIAYLVMSLVVFPGGLSSAEELEIPNVVGLSYDEAVQRLRSYGFAPQRGEERYDANAPIYTVVAQSPRAGERDAIGATVRLDVSRGQLRAEVPMVIGQTREVAERQLADAGFEVGDVTSRNDAMPRGTVISTSPSPGTMLPVPSEVGLVVSAGPSTVELPDATGQSLAEARLLLEQLGLRSRVTYDSLSYMMQNTVIGQTPAAGQRVRAGATVTLIVAGRP